MLFLPWNWWGVPPEDYEGLINIRIYSTLSLILYSYAIYVLIAITCRRAMKKTDDKITSTGLNLLFYSMISMILFFLMFIGDTLMIQLFDIYVTVYKDIKRVDFKIELENNSKDHRIRVLFPSKLKSKKVDSDGHFYVISRDIEMPKSERWAQQPVPTNHQKDFVSINDTSRT
ncbi:unnamed protein product, partial [marine sediment metagenome]